MTVVLLGPRLAFALGMLGRPMTVPQFYALCVESVERFDEIAGLLSPGFDEAIESGKRELRALVDGGEEAVLGVFGELLLAGFVTCHGDLWWQA